MTVWICVWTLCATLSVPLHMMCTYSYWQCCHTPTSRFTVCHITLHTHTDWRGRYKGTVTYWPSCKVTESRRFVHIMCNVWWTLDRVGSKGTLLPMEESLSWHDGTASILWNYCLFRLTTLLLYNMMIYCHIWNAVMFCAMCGCDQTAVLQSPTPSVHWLLPTARHMHFDAEIKVISCLFLC